MDRQKCEDMAKQLDDAQAPLNSGRGVSCVRSMITYLRMGDYDQAQRIYQWDGDKTRQYTELEKVLVAVFGCRSHGKLDCKNEWCVAYYESIFS